MMVNHMVRSTRKGGIPTQPYYRQDKSNTKSGKHAMRDGEKYKDEKYN